MIPHKLQYKTNFNGKPEEYCKNLEGRDANIFLHSFFFGDAPQPQDRELPILKLPVRRYAGEMLLRLEYYLEMPSPLSFWEQAEQDIPPTEELACVVEFYLQADGTTDIVATCLHPAFEQEFRSIFGIDAQDKTDTMVTQAKSAIDKGPRDYNADEKRSIVEQYLDIQRTVKQQDFASQYHVDDRTLRRWIAAYKNGKL